MQNHPALPPTEVRNAASRGLDELPTLDILRVLNDADREVAAAVAETLPAVAQVVDAADAALRAGGKVVYFGAGTSGRLAVLDAAELAPTFALEPGRVEAHIAGGREALVRAIEDSEDSEPDGEAAAATLAAGDVAVGITASGSTPYVRGALRAARAAGATTALVTSNPAAPLARLADVVIAPDTGPEVLTGSTRLKAGTAAKLVLNGFSTALMVRQGRVYDNLMVAVVATNAKLRRRSVRILQAATGLAEPAARDLLADADGDVRTALVAHLAGVAPAEAARRLAAARHDVRAALGLPTPVPVPAPAPEPEPAAALPGPQPAGTPE